MEQQFKTITQTSEDTIICDGVVWYTRSGYNRMLGFSKNSIGSPYVHVRLGIATKFNFFNTSFFRPV